MLIVDQRIKIFQELVSHALGRIFGRFLITRGGHTRQQRFVTNDVADLVAQRFRDRSISMIENKAGHVIANEIAETIEVRNEHSATMRHRFKRRESKRFAALG